MYKALSKHMTQVCTNSLSTSLGSLPLELVLHQPLLRCLPLTGHQLGRAGVMGLGGEALGSVHMPQAVVHLIIHPWLPGTLPSYPLAMEGVPACLPSSCHAKIKLYCGPYGPKASIFHGIWIKQSGAIVFIFNLDKVSLKKLFPTMNI